MSLGHYENQLDNGTTLWWAKMNKIDELKPTQIVH